MPRKWNVEKLAELVPQSRNRTDLLRRLNLCVTGGNAKTIQNWIDKLGLDTSHFENRSDVAKRTVGTGEKIPLEEILVKNSTYARFHLKKRLIEEGLLQEVCSKCGQKPEWYGEPMSLILDHINGIRDDSRLSNLRLLCPNCNATLPTHCSKNKPHSGVEDVG